MKLSEKLNSSTTLHSLSSGNKTDVLHELLDQAHQFDANLREALEARMARLPAPEDQDYDTQDPMVG